MLGTAQVPYFPARQTDYSTEHLPILRRVARLHKDHYIATHTTTTMALTQSFGTSAIDASRPASRPASRSQPEPAQLPPPQTFDILPPLHELLARIDHAPNDPMHAATSADDVVTYSEPQPLEAKDLPNEVIAIKSRIRKALRELEKLPDMDRDVEEQEAEIRKLEQKAAKQKDVLQRLGDIARNKMR